MNVSNFKSIFATFSAPRKFEKRVALVLLEFWWFGSLYPQYARIKNEEYATWTYVFMEGQRNVLDSYFDPPTQVLEYPSF